MSAYRRTLVWAGVGLIAGALLFAFRQPARALPEYMARTGEACATCHVNPAGGGPLTARGSLWLAEGKPDQVPPLPPNPAAAAGNSSGGRPAQTPLAPVEWPAGLPGEAQSSRPASEGPDLYVEFGCSGCHGVSGEGASAPALNRGELPADQLSRITRDGKGSMPGYQAGVLPDADLALLVRYVQAIGRSEVAAQSNDRPKVMEPARERCGNGAGSEDKSVYACDGN